MKKTYVIIDVASGTIYTREISLDDVCKWIDAHCTQSILHNNKIYATYIVDDCNTAIVTVDVYFADREGVLM